MSTVRLRRLTADFQSIQSYVRLHPRVKLIQADGDPPEKYQIEFRVKSIRMVNGDIKRIKSHLVEIHLPRNYPRVPPQCRMLTPIFHPNIAPHAICVGDHWSAGESLRSIVMRIGEILAFQSHNIKSPLNGEAAQWVENNSEQLPLDGVSFLVDKEEPAPPPQVEPTTVQSNETTTQVGNSEDDTYRILSEPKKIAAKCPHCETRYNVPSDVVGKKTRCKKCRTVFVI